MKPSLVASIALSALVLPIAWWVVFDDPKSALNRVEEVRRDCVLTAPENRDERQRSRCEQIVPGVFVILGLL